MSKNQREKLIANQRSNYPADQKWIAAQFKLKAALSQEELKKGLDVMCNGECEMPFFKDCGDGWVVVFYREKNMGNGSNS